MAKNLVFIFIVVLFFSAVNCQDCTGKGPNPSDLIESGKATILRNTDLQSRHQCYTFPLKYTPPDNKFEIILSTSDLSAFNNQNGYDYMLRGGSSNKQGLIVVTVGKNQTWTKIQVNYFISSRNDIFIGSFYAGCSGQASKDTVQTAHTIANLPQNRQNFIVAVFFSGIMTESKNFSLTVLNKQVNTQSGVLTVVLRKDQNSIIESIAISFIIVSNLNFQTTLGQNIQNNHDYFFSGVTEIAPLGQGIRFADQRIGLNRLGPADALPCEGGKCLKACVSNVECFQTGGRIIQNKCVNCQPQQSYQNGKCIRNCGLNQYRDQITGQCLCFPQYLMHQGACYFTCRANAVWFNGICTCVEGFTQFGSVCNRTPSCQQNQVLVNGNCQCKQGTVLVNGRCVQIPTCSQNQQLSGFNCICKPGFQRISNNCVEVSICRENQIFVNGKCQCKGGFIEVSGICRQIPKCLQNEQLNGFNCICKPGFTKVDGRTQCQKIQTCTELQIRTNQNTCECKNGYRKIKGVCLLIPTCTVNQQYDSDLNKCNCITNHVLFQGKCTQRAICNSQTQNLIQQQNRCVCKQGYTKASPNASCILIPVCKSNQVLVNNVCECIPDFVRNQAALCIQKPCPADQIRVNGVCKCKIGFIEFGPICAPLCGVNSQFVIDKCICKPGFDQVNGVCRKCPQYSKPNQAASACECIQNYDFNQNKDACILICKQNQIKVKSNAKQQCQCRDGYARDNKKLCVKINSVQCPQRSIWNQQKLICECTESNEYLIDGKCQSCGINSGWNGQKCVCLTGFFLISNQCKSCPQNTQYNGRECTCRIGFFQSSTKQCIKCHDTCIQCKGPNINDCLICSSVNLTLQSDGTCANKNVCQPGKFLTGSTCRPCSSYCSSCENQNVCKTCIEGYQIKQIALGGVSGGFCFEKCGDAIRFQLPCDDGNNLNGDGCTAKCQIQPGYTCVGGSSTRPSTCQKTTIVRSIITPRKGVLLFGRVVYGIFLTHIPTTLRQNNCNQCSKILDIKVIQSQLVPQVKVEYLQKTQYQFLIEFNFFGINSIPPFVFSVRINQSQKQFFSAQDLSQIQIVRVDPALLAKVDEQPTLTFDELRFGQNTVDAPQQAIDASFK